MPFVPTSFHASFHGSLWASSCQWVLAEAAAASVFIPHVSQSCPWPPASAGDPPILAGRSGPVSYEVTALFPGSWCAHDIGSALHIWSFFSLYSLVEFLGSNLLVFKAAFSGGSSSCNQPPGWEALHCAQEFHTCDRTSLFWGWDLILLHLCPSYHLLVAPSLSLDVIYLFGNIFFC